MSQSKQSTRPITATSAMKSPIKNYIDYANELPPEVSSEDEGCKKKGPRGGVAIPFPCKLHIMLNGVEQNGLSHIVSFQPHGRAFVVHKPKEFVAYVMPHYFNQTKMTSFQRQLNLYGYQRLASGNDRGGYYHPLFLRGREFLAKRIMRTRVKGNGARTFPNPETEPNFYAMPYVQRQTEQQQQHQRLQQKQQQQQQQQLDDLDFTCPAPPLARHVSDDISVQPQQIQSLSKMGSLEGDDDHIEFFEGRCFHSADPSRIERSLERDIMLSMLEWETSPIVTKKTSSPRELEPAPVLSMLYEPTPIEELSNKQVFPSDLTRGPNLISD